MRHSAATLMAAKRHFPDPKIQQREVDFRWFDGTLDQNQKALAAVNHVVRRRRAHSAMLVHDTSAIRTTPQ